MDLPVSPPLKPMLARAAARIPAGMSYEPKWDGFRALVFRDGPEIEIGSRSAKSMLRYFPELAAAFAASLPPRCVLDGEIVVAVGDRLDFAALGQRVHPAASRVARLAAETPAAFVAFDLLALDDTALLSTPFATRRERLTEVLAGVAAPIHLTPATTDPAEAARWFEQFEGAGLDGIVAKPLDAGYQPDKRVMVKIKHERTADCVLAGYRTYAADPTAVGSLLLGLYEDDPADGDGAKAGDGAGDGPATSGPGERTASQGGHQPAGTRRLAAVGVSSAFPLEVRRQLARDLAPLVTELDAHPWAQARSAEGARTPWEAGESRWGKGRDVSFVPLRPELVVEVRYDHLEGPRFRHTTQLVRFRPDRDPASCTYGQLEEPVSYDLADVLR
jgi:ATP-dependent DNA ligase